MVDLRCRQYYLRTMFYFLRVDDGTNDGNWVDICLLILGVLSLDG